MESVKATLSVWPQVLMAFMLILVTIGGFVRHGKPTSNTPINGMHCMWMTLWIALILGMGGFWSK